MKLFQLYLAFKSLSINLLAQSYLSNSSAILLLPILVLLFFLNAQCGLSFKGEYLRLFRLYFAQTMNGPPDWCSYIYNKAFPAAWFMNLNYHHLGSSEQFFQFDFYSNKYFFINFPWDGYMYHHQVNQIHHWKATVI